MVPGEPHRVGGEESRGRDPAVVVAAVVGWDDAGGGAADLVGSADARIVARRGKSVSSTDLAVVAAAASVVEALGVRRRDVE